MKAMTSETLPRKPVDAIRRRYASRAFGTVTLAFLTAAYALSFPVVAAAKSPPVKNQVIEDVRVTPQRTSAGTRPLFTGLLDASQGEAFFNPPTPLPGVPGDVIWAMRSPTPCEDLWTTFLGSCTGRMPPVRGTGRTAEVWRIMYHTLDRAGRSRAVSAIVVADPLTAPTARILLTQHGSYGLGDHCGIIDNPFGGAFAGVGMAADKYISEGWVVVAPSAPGARSPGVQTGIVSGDASRSVIDAVWATHLFTGALPETVIHGHSIGGAMVIGVGGEATSYAPQLTVRGLIVNAPYGMIGSDAPGFDSTRGPLLDDPFDLHAAATKIAALAVVAAYEQAYAPTFRSQDYLTPAGRRLWSRVKDMCVDEAETYALGSSWDKLFRKPITTPDQGTLHRLSNVPTWFIVALHDTYVDPLNAYHAYTTLCAAGQPTYLSVLDTDHINTLRVLSENDRSGLGDWLKTVASGQTPPGYCRDLPPTLSAGRQYTYNQVALALGMRTPPRSTIVITSRGRCRARAEQQRVIVRPGGACTLNVEVRRGSKILEERSLSLRTVS